MLGAALVGTGGLTYARHVEPDWVDLTRIHIELPRLAPEFDNYRIVQLSDIHMYGSMTPEHLADLVRLANEQNPDLITITGDFVIYSPDTSTERAAPALVAALSGLRPRDASVAVLGNHDHQMDPVVVRRVIRDSGLIELSNAVHTLSRGGARVHVAGIDDYLEGQERLDLVLPRIPPDGAAILLAHEPDFADVSAETGRFDLQLSGHSHGGQVRIPLLGPPALPQYARKYPEGQYKVGQMIQYTSRGLGTVPPHVRFNCRPELTVITLATPTAV